MTEHMEATALALDAYVRHLFGDLANGHRTDHVEAEGLLHALVVDLINYGESNRLDMVDLLDALTQARIDRGGAITNLRYSFRLDAEVQFRDHGAEPHRGFITELKSAGPGQDPECVLRIPGIIDPQHTGTSALMPATRMVPLSTRTAGTVFSASAAEDTITDLLTRLPAGHRTSDTDGDPHVLADLAELSTALAAWSGTQPEHVLQHLRYRAGQIHRTGEDWSSTARRAATGFPNDIAAVLAGEQPTRTSSSSRPDPPRANRHPRQM
ncbi:hypothetical protein [Actinomadura bangladeshensis]|uniref:Uncharacterized protein n=1 Tax=Actinomadura bangladeshensis TaxID=453573 RepID=A0A4R4NH33_9ACTN|nr:hypothetical protein [Actinomadura bangladeshensis]TDC06880.1 hypothetical protein E1284_33210 [Actinomadura bangladeshensis]